MNETTPKQVVVLASGNAGKLREFGEVLAPLAVQLKSQAEFAVPEVEETGLCFVENAIIKARAAAQHCQLPAIADDSGIMVDALGGAHRAWVPSGLTYSPVRQFLSDSTECPSPPLSRVMANNASAISSS